MAFSFFAPRIRFVDDRGQLTQHAVVFLRQLWERAGAATGPSTADLERRIDDLGVAPVYVEHP